MFDCTYHSHDLVKYSTKIYIDFINWLLSPCYTSMWTYLIMTVDQFPTENGVFHNYFNSYYIGCSGYPDCKSCIWLPNFVLHAATTDKICQLVSHLDKNTCFIWQWIFKLSFTHISIKAFYSIINFYFNEKGQ